MKKLCLLLITSMVSLWAYGQTVPTFQLGLKGGLNLSKLETSNTFSSEKKAGYYGGVWARIGGAGFHVQPEAYLSGKHASLKGAQGEENKVSFTSLDVPVLIGTRFGAGSVGMRLQTGPVMTFFLDKEQKFGAAASSVFDGDFKDKALAWQFGLGLDLGQISADLRYESGLSKINSAGGYPTTKLNIFTLGVGFRLF